jgi:hypothetical protein
MDGGHDGNTPFHHFMRRLSRNPGNCHVPEGRANAAVSPIEPAIMRHAVLALIAAIAIFASAPVMAEERMIAVTEGYAIGGYDPVAYVAKGVAARGSTRHALMWRGVTWLFESDASMLAFEMNPNAYTPQFGGYCAYSMAEGKLVKGDPEHFMVRAGKIYLLVGDKELSAWATDPDVMIAEAQSNWPDLSE